MPAFMPSAAGSTPMFMPMFMDASCALSCACTQTARSACLLQVETLPPSAQRALTDKSVEVMEWARAARGHDRRLCAQLRLHSTLQSMRSCAPKVMGYAAHGTIERDKPPDATELS